MLALTTTRIHAAGLFGQRLDRRKEIALRDVMRDEAMPPLRRANRYIRLAVIGATRCCRALGAPLPERTGVYLATGHGSLVDTITLMREQGCDELPATPFRFVNVLSNIAGFHVAGQSGIHGENLALARLRGPLDAAIEAAMMDLALGRVERALVGCVDEGDETLEDHRRRTRTPAARMPGEGAGWLLLGPADGTDGTRLHHLGDTGSWRTARTMIEAERPDRLAAGPHAWQRPASLQRAFPGIPVWDYHADYGWSPTGQALAFAAHASRGRGSLLHLDRTAADGGWRLWRVDASAG